MGIISRLNSRFARRVRRPVKSVSQRRCALLAMMASYFMMDNVLWIVHSTAFSRRMIAMLVRHVMIIV